MHFPVIICVVITCGITIFFYTCTLSTTTALLTRNKLVTASCSVISLQLHTFMIIILSMELHNYVTLSYLFILVFMFIVSFTPHDASLLTCPLCQLRMIND